MYQNFDRGLARERTSRMREGVERNRLDARSLAKATRSGEDGTTHRGRVARDVALATVLFR